MAERLKVENPATNSIYITLDTMPADEISEAIVKAHEAHLQWRKVPVKERVEVTRRFFQLVLDNTERTAEEITKQMGKPLWQAKKEVMGCTIRGGHMAEIAEESLKDIITISTDTAFRKIVLEPKGVVVDIASWNYPLLVAVSAIVPAVLSGNAVLIKHSSQTPLCGLMFERLFRKAGVPDGLVTAIVADRASSAALFESPLIKGIFFTGSVEGGYQVNRQASGLLADIGLELGGKDPAYVRADADLATAIPALADSAFYNTGQSCCAVERIYVHESLYEKFVAGFLDEVKQYRYGDPMDDNTYIGPLTQRKQLKVLAEQTEEASARGAELLLGGNITSVNGKGNFFEPTVFAGVANDMKLMQDESFGPIIGIMPTGGDEDAVRLMNDSRFGLTASVWTKDKAKALELAPMIETGTVYMNRADYVEPELAWTGVKESGKGCTLSQLGFIHMTQPKSYCFKTGD